MDNVNDIQISKNFNLKEFQCKGTGEVKLHGELLRLLQSLRDDLGQPLIINSAYRSKSHNERIGGAKRSQHLKGTAVDISLRNLNINAHQLSSIVKRVADKQGISRENLGLGYAKTFLHIDVRGLIGDDSPASWNY